MIEGGKESGRVLERISIHAAGVLLLAACMAVGAARGFTSAHAEVPSQKTNAPQLADLIARIPEVVRGESGIGAEEQDLAKRILPYEARAVPSLLPLLKSGKRGVPDLTGYILRDIDGLKERDLDALIDARLRGNGWIPRAIGRIGTPRAIRFLIEDLEKDPDPSSNSQVVMALVAAGGKAAVPMAKRFADPKPVGRTFSSGIAHVFKEMGENAAPAVDPLIAIVLDKSGNPENRKGAAPESVAAFIVTSEPPTPVLMTRNRIYRVLSSRKYRRQKVWAKSVREDHNRLHVFKFRRDDGAIQHIAYDLDDPAVVFLAAEDLTQVAGDWS